MNVRTFYTIMNRSLIHGEIKTFITLYSVLTPPSSNLKPFTASVSFPSCPNCLPNFLIVHVIEFLSKVHLTSPKERRKSTFNTYLSIIIINRFHHLQAKKLKDTEGVSFTYCTTWVGSQALYQQNQSSSSHAQSRPSPDTLQLQADPSRSPGVLHHFYCSPCLIREASVSLLPGGLCRKSLFQTSVIIYHWKNGWHVQLMSSFNGIYTKNCNCFAVCLG